ncbi:MAG: DUF3783 domain-containing protein [Lachnospiraceae bacterium]|nr:DUF3783 domain-containing protein [Lachnospiraceae bacterium]
MREMILLFEINDPKMKTAITSALLPLKIRVKQIRPEEYGKKLGVLAGTLPEETSADSQMAAADGNQPATTGEQICTSLSDSMLVLCGIQGNKLNLVLSALRSKGVRLPYKAILTPDNQNWKPGELLNELKKEHEAMTSGAAGAHS